MSQLNQKQLTYFKNLYGSSQQVGEKRVSITKQTGHSQDLVSKQPFILQPNQAQQRESQQVEQRRVLISASLTNQHSSQAELRQNQESTSQDWHQPSLQDRDNLCQNDKFEICGEERLNWDPNIQRNQNLEEGQNQNINNQQVCHKNYNQIIKLDQEDIMQNQAPQVNLAKKQIQPQESHTGQCQQPLKEGSDDLQDRIENQGSTEKSDNLSGGKQSGISSTKAQTSKYGISQNIQKEGVSNQFGLQFQSHHPQWNNLKNHQPHSSHELISRQNYQHSTSQQPYISNQRRKERGQGQGFSIKKGSQDSRVAPSFTPSVTPSCGPSSTNALLSDIIRLDDDEEIWLKGQLMGNTASVPPIQDQVLNSVALISDPQLNISDPLIQDFPDPLQVKPEMLPVVSDKMFEEDTQGLQDPKPSCDGFLTSKQQICDEKKSEAQAINEEEDVLKLEISNRHNDEESSCSMQLDKSSLQIDKNHLAKKLEEPAITGEIADKTFQKANGGSSQADPILIDRDDEGSEGDFRKKELSITQEQGDGLDEKDDSGSMKDSSQRQTQQDQTEYMRLYQIQMEKAQQEKIAQYRREAEEAAQAKLKEELASKQKQNESFYSTSQPIQIKDFYQEDQPERKTQEIQKINQSLLLASEKHSDVEMRNESQKEPISQDSKLEKISIDDTPLNNVDSDEDLVDDSDEDEDEYASEQEKEADIVDKDEVKLKRAARTRRFKEFKDRSEGPPLKTMVLKNDELSQFGEKSKSKHRQSNTQRCVSDSETMFDGMMTQQLANTQKNEKMNSSFDQMHEEFLKRMERDDLCFASKRWEHWTKEQDHKLCKLVDIYSLDQIKQVTQDLNEFISDQMMPENLHDKSFVLKNESECADRYLLLKTGDDGGVKQIKGNWTPEEDLILKQKVDEFGLKKWKEIATFLPGRIGKQCRERWYNNVDPNLNKDKWTVAEDIQLMELHKQYGNKWVQIQKFMPGRIDNDIKNRFNASLRKYKSFDEYLESIDKKRSKHKTGNTQHTLNQRNTFSQLEEWKNKYDLKNSASRILDNDFEFHQREKSERSLSNDDRDKKQRLKPRDEKCIRKQDEKAKRRLRQSLDKSEELINSSCTDSEENDVFEQLTQQLAQNTKGEVLPRRKAPRQFSNSEDKRMEGSEIEEVIQKVIAQKGFKKIDGHKFLQEKSSLSKLLGQRNELHEVNEMGEPIDMDEEECRLIDCLLSVDPPKILSSNKLLFRRLFRVTKYSSEEYSRKCKSKYCQSAFEVYTHVPPENTGPKVLYITAKSQDGKDKDSDVIKDIEGHAIEKIHTSKLSEKALQEKWRLEEEELEKVRQARDTLSRMRRDGVCQSDLVAHARHILMTKLSISEFSANRFCMQSDKSDQTAKSFNHIGVRQHHDLGSKFHLNESPTIGITSSQQRPSSSSQFPTKSKQRLNSKLMSDDKNNLLAFETQQLFVNTKGGSQHPNGDPKNLTGSNATFTKIFATTQVTRNQKDKDQIVNLLNSISKNGSLPQVVKNDTYNLRNHNAFYSSSSQNGAFQKHQSNSKSQKIVQINKCGNTASISIIHPGGEKTTCMEKSNVLRGGKPNSSIGRSNNSANFFNKKAEGANSKSNTSQQGKNSKKAESSTNRPSPDKKSSKQTDSKRTGQSQDDGNQRPLPKKPSTEKGPSKPPSGGSKVQAQQSKQKAGQQSQVNASKKPSTQKKGSRESQSRGAHQRAGAKGDDEKAALVKKASQKKSKTASLTAQAEDCKQQLQLAEAGMKTAGQRNSVRIMARKLDQINKKLEQEKSAKNKLRQKSKIVKNDSESESEEDEEEEAEEEQEEEQEDEDEELEIEQEEQEDEQEEIKDDKMDDLSSSQQSLQKEDLNKSEQQIKQVKAIDKVANKTLQEKLKRFELLKKIQNQLNQIKDLRGQKDKNTPTTQHPPDQRLNTSMTSQKNSKDGKAPTTRYSTRLRDRTTSKVLVGGKQLSSRAALLKEKEIRNKAAKEQKMLENQYEHITQDNRYNGFLEKELKIDNSNRSFIQKQLIARDKDQKMQSEQVEKKTPKKDIDQKPQVDQSHELQNQSKHEYTGTYNMHAHYSHGYYGNQFDQGTSMYTVMQQQPMFPPGPHQSQIGSPGYHPMMPGPHQYGQNYSMAPPYVQTGHYSQMQQLQQAQMINDNFNRSQQYPPPPSMPPMHFSSYHETPSRKIEKVHEGPQREDKPPVIVDKRDGKEGEHNPHYGRSMMMFQQKMGPGSQVHPNGGQTPQQAQNLGLMSNLPPPSQPSGMYNYPTPQPGQNGQINSFYQYQFNQNQPQVGGGMPPHMHQGQPISHHQLANMMPPGSSNMTNMTNMMGTSNNSMNINSMRLQEMNSGANINASPSKAQQPQAHRPPPPVINNTENDEKTLTQNSGCEDVEMATKK